MRTFALRDTSTMLRRNLKHMRRYPSMTFFLIAIPVILLLLFVYVFGGALGAGLGGTRQDYANYLTPGILLIAVAGVATGTAISVAMDMKDGIMARFRTMAIFRPSILAGHVIGNFIQAAIALTAVIGVAWLVGFRPTAGFTAWLGVAGVLAMVTFAVIWLSVALGLAAQNVESASNLPMPLTLLPFMGSGFVPTDSMPTGLAWFAKYQPFTPIMETLRGLLFGKAIGNNGWMAAGWCVVLTIVSYLWAKRLFERERAR